MKRKFYFLCIFAAAVFLTAGCSSAEPPVSSENQLETTEGPRQTQPEGQTEEADPQGSKDGVPQTSEGRQEMTAQQEEGPVFQAGTWLATEKGAATYYFFDADGVSGRTASQENGMGIGFTYAVEGSQAVFYMGSADNPANGVLEKADSGQVTIRWEDGREELLIFFSAEGSDSFRFYSNEALCDLAVHYYSSAAGENEKISAAAVTNEDGSVTVQVYENLGDHNSTCAWYNVDRYTGKGTDINTGEEVDFGVSGQE